jgi:HEAT repeat protein
MAAALLARGGEPAFLATAAGYQKLDDAGRILALEVLDGAPCTISASVYTGAMIKGFPGESHHAQTRLNRCGTAAIEPLSVALAAGPDKQRVAAARELALIAPAVVFDRVLAVMPSASPPLKRDLRAALATAAKSDRAVETLNAKLADPTASPETTLDLLRVIGERSELRVAAGSAFARLAQPGLDFRKRYLLLDPAARLSSGGDGNARAFMENALRSDSDPHIRAHAAEVLADTPEAVALLVAALADSDARVRDGALSSQRHRSNAPPAVPPRPITWPPHATEAVVARLDHDPWTYVRAHAADALVTAPPGEEADAPLAHALSDASPQVRARVVESLGARGARKHADAVRARLEDNDEVLDVRTRAARALGAMCQKPAVDLLTQIARDGAGAGATGDQQTLGASAAAALGHLHPADLGERLRPAMAETAPRPLRDAAQAALAETPACGP